MSKPNGGWWDVDIRGYARKKTEVVLQEVGKEEIQSAAQTVFIEIQGKTSVHERRE